MQAVGNGRGMGCVRQTHGMPSISDLEWSQHSASAERTLAHFLFMVRRSTGGEKVAQKKAGSVSGA